MVSWALQLHCQGIAEEGQARQQDQREKHVGGAGGREAAGILWESWFSGGLEADDRWCMLGRGWEVGRGGGEPRHHRKEEGELWWKGKQNPGKLIFRMSQKD